MANAILEGHVLSRSANSFTGEKGRLVEYFEAVVVDGDSLTIVRSSDRADLEAFVPGEAVGPINVEFKKQGKISAPVVGLARTVAASDW